MDGCPRNQETSSPTKIETATSSFDSTSTARKFTIHNSRIDRTVDPNEVVIKRRYGEGAKPLFSRNELLTWQSQGPEQNNAPHSVLSSKTKPIPYFLDKSRERDRIRRLRRDFASRYSSSSSLGSPETRERERSNSKTKKRKRQKDYIRRRSPFASSRSRSLSPLRRRRRKPSPASATQFIPIHTNAAQMMQAVPPPFPYMAAQMMPAVPPPFPYMAAPMMQSVPPPSPASATQFIPIHTNAAQMMQAVPPPFPYMAAQMMPAVPPPFPYMAAPMMQSVPPPFPYMPAWRLPIRPPQRFPFMMRP